ncbi:MAG: hypothetical protein SFW36_19785, partial [Leptolyngbyaceae cyanobacterium bins.59]|nr:hypothetical protein [Leptolyngbyaceae cyanobacterium bins.59]
VPNVARIKIGNEERCTRDIEAGQYTYDEATRSLRAVDNRRETIGQRLQLSMLERCPSASTPTVKLNVVDNSQQFVYCATPNRFVKAGEYNYDYASDNLQPVGTSPVTSQPGTTPTDSRKQALQRDYGLQVMDTCPSLRTGLVVVAVQDSTQPNQGSVYCAQPNRVVKAGEYVYNNATGNLETAQKTEQCTVSLGGICIVK